MKTKTFKPQRVLFLSLMIAGSVVLNSCNSSRTLKGGAIGAGAGGAIGGIIGSGSDHTAEGAIIGAAIGGTAGALIGRYMDKQAEELAADLEGATVERVGEGIKITFDSGILFGFDQSALTPEAEENIAELAETLQKYDDTNILIEGYTDNKGSEQYNLALSEARAESVALRLTNLNVASSRLQLEGYGESMPVADNSTEAGRQKNRRVEVAIMANKKLQRAAERGDLDV
ncbi:OmpA family protein [Mangrovibacterium diazotrophicum]|uniref:Outer membrane protein OmpA-like peptidoglycan-associated protein n=1 Tax=Mangrovibacterium diazotrophicum TaxID=1261403 RepID=A0A419W6M9_9BACT|nr:OmpA family protein [Mangrovibacterium diazotrophicum]RKD91117.1 outer membrane protein OmpA-like peptidoglycan-associated protein [Mangrovibacterium diazotrophicum]